MPPSKREPGDSTGAGEDLGLDGRARASILKLQNPIFDHRLPYAQPKGDSCG
jgi:hypothetical protein